MLNQFRTWLPHGALFDVLEQDLEAGLEAAAIVASNPFQRWAAGRALLDFVSAYPDQLFPALDHLLRHPAPYVAVSTTPAELARAADPHFSTQLLLAEMADLAHLPGLSERLARFFTAPLRRTAPEPLQSLVKIYYAWLVADAPTRQEALVLLTASLRVLAACMWDDMGRPPADPEACVATAQNQHARFWMEVCQSFRAWKQFLAYETAEDLAQAVEQVAWAADWVDPLRADVLTVLLELARIGSELAVEPEPLARLARIGTQAEQLPPPESDLAAITADHWADLVAAKG